ncbi:hypothetical protein CYMTET_44450 [Cymbomonas tetramitiformis]|uniref:Uncharacterized protein n=1 Tax=Cymbomonas tetramitiformis TaxID=36881 RepID=A0AAE0C060_9CHLO|nr:hypothetical protein CYMTET_44450 [Cymbomonas tetramitiformis]
MGPVAPVDSVSVTEEESEDDDEGNPPPRRALGCGIPPLGFGYSALTSLAVCMLFIVCAAAGPSAASAFGGVGLGAETAPPVGGVVHGLPGMLLAPTTALRTSSIDNRAIPPFQCWRPAGWYSAAEIEWSHKAQLTTATSELSKFAPPYGSSDSADTDCVSENSGTNSPGRGDSGTGSPGRFKRG